MPLHTGYQIMSRCLHIRAGAIIFTGIKHLAPHWFHDNALYTYLLCITAQKICANVSPKEVSDRLHALPSYQLLCIGPERSI